MYIILNYTENHAADTVAQQKSFYKKITNQNYSMR